MSNFSRRTIKETKLQQSIRSSSQVPTKIITPTKVDVLCGRGGGTNHHKGNILYKEDKAELQPSYKAAIKTRKIHISSKLVDRVHARGGRFLKRNKEGDWQEITTKEALVKAGQTLRESYTPEDRRAKRARFLARNKHVQHELGPLPAVPEQDYGSTSILPDANAGLLDSFEFFLSMKQGNETAEPLEQEERTWLSPEEIDDHFTMDERTWPPPEEIDDHLTTDEEVNYMCGA